MGSLRLQRGKNGLLHYLMQREVMCDDGLIPCEQSNTVKSVLSGPHMKWTPCIKQTSANQ